MKQRYKVILAVLSLLLIPLVYLCFSYSSYEKVEKNTTDTLVMSNEFISVNYLDGNYYNISNFKDGDTIIKKLSITNVTSSPTFITISLMDINKKTNNLRIKLVDSKGEEIYNNDLGNADLELLKTKEIEGKETLSYTIYITYQGDDDNYGLTANLLAFKESTHKVTSTLSQSILNNNNATKMPEKLEDGSFTNEGLIHDETNDIYFFRGVVNNNYVKFANYTWRILRINEDKSVRLILDGVLPEAKYYKQTIDQSDYLTNINYSNTDLKTELENFLNNDLKDYTSYLSTTKICSDITVTEEKSQKQYLSSYTRTIVNKESSITCQSNIEEANIGLPSIDEVMLAGASTSKENNGYFLSNPNITSSWWTISASVIIPNSNVIDAFTISSRGNITYLNKITTKNYLRPVITIDKTVLSNGFGSESDPYTIG